MYYFTFVLYKLNSYGLLFIWIFISIIKYFIFQFYSYLFILCVYVCVCIWRVNLQKQIILFYKNHIVSLCILINLNQTAAGLFWLSKT